MRLIAGGRPQLASRLSIGVALALLLSATVAQSTPSTVSASWFDQPLPASQHPLEPVAITAHSTSPGGISQIELLVDGVSAETRDFADAPLLAEADFDWSPAIDGVYWLVVRGRSGGEWGPSAAILIKIGQTAPSAIPSPSLRPSLSPSPSAGASPTITAEPTRSPQATPTSTPPPTPRATATPRPTPTPTPTARPTPTPTVRPTATPTQRPTPTPTPRPTATPRPTPRPTPTPLCTPPAPQLTDPENGTTVESARVTLRWDYRNPPSCAPSGFYVEVSLEDQVGEPVVTHELGRAAREWLTPALDNCTSYQWRVFAIRSDGAINDNPSEVHSFYVKYERTCP